ncbi:Hypothetical protein PHPALM_3746 [Phytophthora palmivora]|uniref:RING-type domain-containing protein n=1 Tax=Phytophthora palmivora TaxID=4796 RepID=A0A2P4YLL2_9STRA|nr:Hypothetical protein PHPALM_3746 [Phytophthora palmivora]
MASSCPICLCSFERPVLASCCGQSFCRLCLDDALRQVDACPMCRSPLLSGPFSVTSNRALEDALAALASSSPRRSTTEKRIVTSFVDAVERKLTVAARNSASEVQISLPHATETDNSEMSLTQNEEEQTLRVQFHFQWRERLRLWRSAELRRRLRQWQLWCRVNWASLQCVFYVTLFFVFVFFLRIEEEEFAETTRHLRRPN